MAHNKGMDSLEIEQGGTSVDEKAQEKESRYLIDPIWPLREVHIITGESRGLGRRLCSLNG